MRPLSQKHLAGTTDDNQRFKMIRVRPLEGVVVCLLVTPYFVRSIAIIPDRCIEIVDILTPSLSKGIDAFVPPELTVTFDLLCGMLL